MTCYTSSASPESKGIHTENIVKFAKALTEKGVCLHSLLIYRGGDLIAEGYEKHFNKDTPHRMYSVSKTFTSAAIGCLAGEGRIGLDDKVCKFFPDKYEGEIHHYIEEATIRDLLVMATPFDKTTYNLDDKDWVRTFFNTIPSHRPGTVFNYDTSATLVLDAIIQRVTGLDFTDYLYEKVLKFIGFREAPACVREPGGVQWGGSGVLCTPRELGSFALLFMNDGKDKSGNQLIPAEYAHEAVKMQICNAQNNSYASFRNSGYGYQIWITETGFAFLGMGNQLAVCVPEKDIMLICTADDQGNPYARDHIFEMLNEMIIKNAGEPGCSNGELLCLDDYLKLPLPCKTDVEIRPYDMNGKEFRLQKNKYGFESFRFVSDGDNCSMKYVRNGVSKHIDFGAGHYVDGIFPEIFSGMTINKPCETGYRCTSAGVWAQDNLLVIRCYIIDTYLGNITFNISFASNSLDIHIESNAEWFLEEYNGFLSSES